MCCVVTQAVMLEKERNCVVLLFFAAAGGVIDLKYPRTVLIFDRSWIFSSPSALLPRPLKY
jgi:hypothetical protein